MKKPYVRANNKIYSKRQALLFSKWIIDNRKEASSVVVGVKQKPNGRFTKTTLNIKFRKPKKNSRLPKGAIVEKRKYRLDTSGEKRQISYKKRRKTKRKPKKKTKSRKKRKR